MYDRRNTQRGLFAAMTLVMASCAQIVGMEEGVLRDDGPAPECTSVSDCQGDASECKTALACTDGRCVYENVIRGTRLSTQTIGDCRDVVCDGDGATEIVVADTDIEDDSNGCTEDTCNAGKPVHTPIPGQIVSCYEGPAGTAGVSFCKEGTQVCDDQGNPTGPCEGQVLPEAEVCDAMPIDENCNGLVNETGVEGGTCSCGDGITSAAIGELCDDGNLVGGDGCSPICSPLQVVELSVGSVFACVRWSNDVVKCWGGNAVGQLGIENKLHVGDEPGEMGANLVETSFGMKQPIKLELAFGFSCAIMNDATLRCWGFNDRGQLGEGSVATRGDDLGEMGDAMPVIDLGPGAGPAAVTGGRGHTCALLTDGGVKCWGAGGVGQLGLGDGGDRGKTIASMGANLPLVDLGTGRTAKALATGYFHNCAILDDDSVKCWGDNFYGNLGLGYTTDHGSGQNQMGDNLPVVNLGTGKIAKSLALGDNHACAILNDGTVKCWGKNEFGELGLGDVENRGDGPDEMGDNLPTVDLGTGRTAVAIAADLEMSCAILDDGSLKCWGSNTNGKLGQGDTLARGDEPGEMGDALLPIDLGMGRKAVSVEIGEQSVCALLDDSSVKCWGQGSFGRLGLGDEMTRGDEPGEMGDNLPIVKLFSETW